MWDLRKNYSPNRHGALPMQTYPYAGSSTRMRLGYSGLVLDSSRSNIMCNCTDDSIYMFNVCGIKTTPVAVFSGHQNSSFYVKSTISPDDQFLASGSSDNHLYIWKISDPQHPPMMLQGHNEEVTSVAWCPTDFTKIASCSDDHTIRIWRLHRETDGAHSSVGEANLVGWARPKPPSMPPVRAVTPPVKTHGTQSLGGLASPQLAACAPNRAALPLPSSTTSPGRLAPALVHQKTPSSIQQWLSPSRESPSRVAATPPQQLLRLRSASPASSAPPTEQRAKRRLETDDSSPCCCEDAHCACTSEHYPAAKRSCVLSSVSCPAQQRSVQKDCRTEDSELVTPRQIGKENLSPVRAGNWLSELGQKMKKSQEGPGSQKKQDGKIPASTVHPSPRIKKISMYFAKRTQERFKEC